MSLFEKSLGICGLSNGEAALLFQISDSEMADLISGAKAVPARIWMMMSTLHDQLSRTTSAALATYDIDMIGPDQMQEVAVKATGDELAPPLLKAALATFILSRFLSDAKPAVAH